MSINDLIATSSVNAFNQGVSTGRRLEREMIIKILADEKVAKDLSFFARNADEDSPQKIKDSALMRIEKILDQH
jgi:hypothetical protein